MKKELLFYKKMIRNLCQQKSQRAFTISNFQYPSDRKKFIEDWMQN